MIGLFDEKEQEDVVPKGCPIFEQRIHKKYGNLRFLDPDEEKLFTVHQDRFSFQKKMGANSSECFVLWIILKT